MSWTAEKWGNLYLPEIRSRVDTCYSSKGAEASKSISDCGRICVTSRMHGLASRRKEKPEGHKEAHSRSRRHLSAGVLHANNEPGVPLAITIGREEMRMTVVCRGIGIAQMEAQA